MGNVKLLDCTLRDGGYINDWRFGEQAIPDMIESLEQTNVDILELGFLKDEPYQKDRTVFRSMEQVKKLIPNKKPGTQYAVMCEVVNPLPLDLLEPADADSADIIRVIVWKTKHTKDGKVVDALQEGYEYCKGIVDKGYKLCVQPARVSQYSDEEFVAMVRQFSGLDPMAIYVVDSWGTENAESLLHYMHLADDNMPRTIALGYHGHNNMMQALGCAQAMLKEGFERELIIDASVYGIGRGAGNLNLEIIAKYLNEEYGKCYEITPMLEISNDYINAIYSKEQWGFSLPYFLTATYNCNPAYARYYKNLASNEIAEILKNFSPEDQIIYREKTAKQYLESYIQKKKKIAIIIPTKNDSKAIDRWLYSAAVALYQNSIDIIIYDQSDDSKTEVAVNNFIFDGFKNIFYCHCKENPSDKSQTIRSIYQEFSSKYEYLWIHDSEFLLDYRGIAKRVQESVENKVDIIVVTPSWREDDGAEDQTYTDPRELFHEKCLQMTTLGTVILSSSVASELCQYAPSDVEIEPGVWQMEAIFRYFADKDISANSYVDYLWNYNFATSEKRYEGYDSIKLWCTQWYQCISNLPQSYDCYKQEVYKAQRKDYHPFYMKSLLESRANGSLTLRSVKENRAIIPQVSDTSIKKFYIVAAMPRFIARFLTKHENSKITAIVKGIYYTICGIVPGEREILS